MSKKHLIYPWSLNTLYKCILNNDRDGKSLQVTSVPHLKGIPRAERSPSWGVLPKFSSSYNQKHLKIQLSPLFKPILILRRNSINNSSPKEGGTESA